MARFSADEQKQVDAFLVQLDASGKALSRLRAELGTALSADDHIKAAWFAGAAMGRATEVANAVAQIGQIAGMKARAAFPE